jgi:hypothetical protein
MAVQHAKKHDINDVRDHIKNNLDLDGSLRQNDNVPILLDTANTKSILWNSASTRFEFNDDLYAPYFVGDGSLLTNITAEALNLSANEWLYFNYPTNTVGVRYNTTPVPNVLETNAKFYAPNIESGNAVVCSLLYSSYHVLGNTSYSPGITDQVFYMINPTTGKITATMSKQGAYTFWGCDLNNSYIIWKDSATPTPATQAGIGIYNNAGTYELEIYTQNTTTDPIQMYSTTNLWEDTAIQDGKYLHFDTARTKNVIYNSTNDSIDFNSAVRVGNLASAPSTPINGQIYYNTTSGLFQLYQNGSWAGLGGTSYWTQTSGVLHPTTSTDSIGIANLETFDFNYGGTAKTLLYDDTTNNRFEFNDSVYTAGDFYAYGALNLTAGNEVEFNYGATAKTLFWSSANSRFEFNDKLKAPNARIGGDTNYTEFDTSGIQTMAGTARYNETLQWTANQLSAISGTYNAISNNASTAGTLNGFYFRVFDDGPTAEACNTAFVLPAKYVAGTDFTVSFCWTVGGTSTNAVRWQAGCARVMAGETYSPITSVDTWGTPVNVAAPGTTWARVRTDITVSGTGFQAGDLVRLIVFRDGGNAGDTYTGDAYISCVGVTFLCDRL